MRKALLFLFLFSAIGCAQQLRIIWKYPTKAEAEADTTQKYLSYPDSGAYFIVYVWQGDTTEANAFADSLLDSIATVPFVPGKAGFYEVAYHFDPKKIIRGAVLIVDERLRASAFSITPFFGWPLKPKDTDVTNRGGN